MGLDKLQARQVDIGAAAYFSPIPETPPGNQIIVQAGWVKNEDNMIPVAEQITLAFNAVTAAARVRWDLVYIDLLGVVHVSQGVEQVNTVTEYTGVSKPPQYSVPIAFVKIDEIGGVEVGGLDITDLRPKLNFIYNSNYFSNYIIVDQQKPDVAISAIDAEVKEHSKYTGKERAGTGGKLPQYSGDGSPEYAIANSQDLQLAMANIDVELDHLRTFLRKANLAATTPSYTPETSGHFIGVTDAVAMAIGKLDAALHAHRKGSLEDYHVAQAIYQALIAYGGYAPSSANPFATKDYANAAAVAGALKMAWGFTGFYSYSVPAFSVNLSAGVSGNGTYNGNSGFTAVPKIIIAPKYTSYYCCNSGWCKIPDYSAYAGGFSVGACLGGAIYYSQLSWLAIGT